MDCPVLRIPKYRAGQTISERKREDGMDLIILGIMALVTLLWWASAARWRTAVAARRQAKLSRPRIR